MIDSGVARAGLADEMLVEGAPIQWRLAQELCGAECRWYHGPRLYLRALGVARGVEPDRRFLLEALEPLARARGRARVLVSGAADHGILGLVRTAFAAAGGVPDVTAVDLCDTPLRMQIWYGDRTGVRVRAHLGDILSFRSEEPFDLVVTHAFFGRFDPAGRRRLFERWHALLRPGGAVVTACRLRTERPGRRAPLAARDRERIRERARLAVARGRHFDGVTAESIVQWTNEFVRRKQSYPIRSLDEIRDLLIRAGFEIEVASTHDADPAGRDRSDAPIEASPRIGIVARRVER
jgi:SAM-dependent methyltransferase